MRAIPSPDSVVIVLIPFDDLIGVHVDIVIVLITAFFVEKPA